MEAKEQVALCPLSTADWTIEQDLRLATSLGLRRLSVTTSKLERAGGMSRVAQLIGDAGFRIDVVYPSVGLDLSRPKGWAPAREALRVGIEVAAELGATGVLVTAGGRGMPFERAVETLDAFVEPLRSGARATGIDLLLEPVRTQFAYAGFVHTLRDGVALAEALDMGLVVDITHCWWEPCLHATLAAAVGRIAVVHLADLALDGPVLDRVVPGDGDLPIASFLSALLTAGYEGPFEVELMGPAIRQEGIAAALTRAVNVVCSLWPHPTS